MMSIFNMLVPEGPPMSPRDEFLKAVATLEGWGRKCGENQVLPAHEYEIKLAAARARLEAFAAHIPETKP